MSVSSTDNQVIYTGTGTTGPFDFDFRVYATSDLLVQKLVIATEVISTLTETTDYVVTVDEDGTGYITTVAAVTSTYKLIISRVLPLTQEVTYVENDKFPAATHEEALDRSRMIDQQLQEQIDRCVKVPAGSTLDVDQLVTSVTEAAGAAETAQVLAEAAQAAAEVAQAAAELAETNAETAETNAETAETNAETAQAAAEAARDLAQTYAAALVGTSVSSVAIGTGSKTFTTQAGKQWVIGDFVIIANTADPANYMWGQVTNYTTTSLVVNVLAVGGSGTLASWNISISGIQGATGAQGDQGDPGATGPAGDGLFNSSPILAKTGTYTLVAADRDKLVTLSGTFTVTLPAIVDGYVYKLANVGAGTITIAANGAETSEVTSLAAGASVILIGDLAATKWRSLAKDAGVAFHTPRERSSTETFPQGY